jgi:cytosine/adenosine deaminase-related metal-dependent hydrolase
MSSVLLSNCRLLVTMDDAGRELTGASLLAEDGWITSIGVDSHPADEVLECDDKIVIPGLVNTHHHLYQTLTRGFPESAGQPLFDWLKMLYPIWAGLDVDMIRASTCAGLAELALSGCTTCADHLYVFPPGSDEFIDAEFQAASSIGLRFHATRGSMDLSQRDGGLPPDSVVQSIDVILQDSERVIDRYHDANPGSMRRVGLAPCSPFSATPQLMRDSADLARMRGVRLHTHIAETRHEEEYSRLTFGLTPIELLRDLGWISSDVWVAHCVHPGEKGIALLAEGQASVAHCPTSNMLLGSGLAPVVPLLAGGVAVGLGVDGSASNDGNDLKGEVKQAVLVARARDGAGALSVRQALRLATRGGASCLGREDIGSLEIGKIADLVTFDAGALELAGGAEDLLAAAVLGAARPSDVMVHGRWIVKDGELLTADADAIAVEQNRQSARLLQKWRKSR